MEKYEISKATLGRIPMYINYIESLSEDVQNISATKISKELGLGEVQVRKDLSTLCKCGKPKIGYDRNELLNCLKDFFTTQNGDAVVIGAGKLGMSLLEYNGFEVYGTTILAAFDKNVEKAIALPTGKEVLPIDMLKSFCKTKNIQIGIITTPAETAQSVLNLLCDCGIKLIWCFAPCRLYTPADVTVKYENLALSLAHLKLQSYQK